jgi:sugar lactone lactonase YvrE
VGNSLFGFGNRDGTGKAALLHYPQDIKADPQRRMLWVADTYNNKIRRVGLDTRYVSSPAVDRGLNEPGGLAFQADTLYIANTNAHEILCFNPDDGHATTLNVTEEIAEV